MLNISTEKPAFIQIQGALTFIILLNLSAPPLSATTKKPVKPVASKHVNDKPTANTTQAVDVKTREPAVTTAPEPAKPVEKKSDVVFENFNDGLGKWKLDGSSFTDPVWKNPDFALKSL